jgi:outer membrane protein
MAVGKHALLLSGYGILLVAAQAAAQMPKVTLAEAIERANQVQPSVVQAFGSVRNAEARQRSATGAFIPSLSVGASRSQSFSEGQQLDPSTGQFITSGSSSGSLGLNLSSSIDLFTGFRRLSDKKSANANRNSAEASLVNAKANLQLTTTNQYFDVLAAAQLLTVRAASVRRAEEQLRNSVALLHAGRGIRPDSLRAVVTLGNAQLQLVSAQASLSTAQANLGRLVGEDGPVDAVDDSSLYTLLPVVDTADLRAEVLAAAPSVRSAEASAAAAQASIGSSKAAYFPSLRLSGSGSFNGSSRNSYTLLQQRQLSLSLSWPLFNGFQREASITSAQVSAETADANAAEARRQVLASLTTYLASLDAARLRINIAQTNVLASTENLRVQQERYRLGAATIVDVLTSQEALDQAEVDAVTARFDYVRARAQISALIGRPL